VPRNPGLTDGIPLGFTEPFGKSRRDFIIQPGIDVLATIVWHGKSQRDFINQPGVGRRSRPTPGELSEMNTNRNGLNPCGRWCNPVGV